MQEEEEEEEEWCSHKRGSSHLVPMAPNAIGMEGGKHLGEKSIASDVKFCLYIIIGRIPSTSRNTRTILLLTAKEMMMMVVVVVVQLTSLCVPMVLPAIGETQLTTGSTPTLHHHPRVIVLQVSRSCQ